jgi:hypothetical protein
MIIVSGVRNKFGTTSLKRAVAQRITKELKNFIDSGEALNN